jgi:K+-sensing histidine kinase KdpD
VSERRRTIDGPSQREAKTSALSIDEEFISRISHDLRTPLAAIKAAIGVVLANEPPGTTEPLSRMFRNIDRATDQLNSMIANIAESARLARGASAMRCDLLDLRDVMQRVARTADITVRRQGQRLAVQTAAKPCLVMGDGPRIERALLNLLDNAQKYGRQDGTIGLRLERKKSEAVFAVTDDGPGISEDAIEEIFEGRDPAAEGSGRVGLGLPVAKTIAELHGGRIWVEAASGRGVTFCLTFPAVPDDQLGARAAKPRIKDGNA